MVIPHPLASKQIFFFLSGCPYEGGCPSPGARWAYPGAGSDLEGLKYSDLAECNLEVGSNSSRSLERIKSQDLGSSLSIQSLPKAVEVMEEMQQRVQMDQSET